MHTPEALRQLYYLLVDDRIQSFRYMRELRRQVREYKRGERTEIDVPPPQYK